MEASGRVIAVCSCAGADGAGVIGRWPAEVDGMSHALAAASASAPAAIHVDDARRVEDRASALAAMAPSGTVLLSGGARALVPPETAVQDLGHHRLEDLLEAEHVFALADDSIVELTSLSTAPHNLPVELTSFVGRREEIAALLRQLGHARLVTLTGPGGAGKSRLARRVAAARVTDQRDGVWLIELANVTSPPDGLGVASAFTILTSADAEPVRDLEDLISRIGDRQLLVVLDQCEHVRIECAQVLERLLAMCPGLRVLATSREPLGVRGEQLWPVPPLADGDAQRLFLERSATNDDEEAALTRLCDLVDRSPLGIELAAGWTNVLSASEIVARLEDRLGFLDASPAASVSRLGAALDWSFEQLSPPQRLLLTRLCVFTGGFTAAAAEQVCADRRLRTEDVLPALAVLAERSLVTPQSARAPERRFRLNDVVRQYAIARLTDGSAADAPVALVTYAFRREGEYWTIGDATKPFRLKDSRGLRHLHLLVSQPGRELHVLDLASPQPDVVDTSDAGDTIDAQARDSYRRRLVELEEEREEARRNNDIARLHRLDDEWDALTQELSSALGLGGRARKASSTSERARSTVTKAVRAAVDRIAANDAALGRHLQSAVKTGAFCSYTPDQEWPGEWLLDPVKSTLTP